jgi:hypothetical protein
VADRRVEVVVIVERVRGGAIDHRCGRRWGPAAADHRAFARRRNLRRNRVSHGMTRKIIGAGHHAADGIGDRVDGALAGEARKCAGRMAPLGDCLDNAGHLGAPGR